MFAKSAYIWYVEPSNIPTKDFFNREFGQENFCQKKDVDGNMRDLFPCSEEKIDYLKTDQACTDWLKFRVLNFNKLTWQLREVNWVRKNGPKTPALHDIRQNIKKIKKNYKLNPAPA